MRQASTGERREAFLADSGAHLLQLLHSSKEAWQWIR